jgi:hypothetical protein
MAGLSIRSVVRELNPALGSLELFRHPRTPLPLTRVNRHAFFSSAALPYLWTSPLESSWLVQEEKNRAGKRYHERRKERPKAVA